jgi:putative transposase
MPWKETCVVDERMRFVVEHELDEVTMAELCRKYAISRKTGYKWLKRVETEGLAGLVDLSRAPHRHPNQLAAELEESIIALRQRHPTWGPRKLRELLPGGRLPAASTLGELLQRRGLAVPRKRCRRVPAHTQPFAHCGQPNDIWCADFKGWFRTGDGSRCDPLTITDACSRYVLRCQVLPGQDYQSSRPVFEAAFREFGLPRAMRTDNGSPFASRALGGLSRLSVWWIKLGIGVERIEAGKPQQNGRHERMHLTLKRETAQPPAASGRAQQQRFDAFRQEFNQIRPHEALAMRTPASVYVDSPRPYPSREPQLEYPAGWRVRKVRYKGGLGWKYDEIFLTEVLAGEEVGLEPVDERYWRVWFGPLALAILDTHGRRMLTPAQRRKLGLALEPAPADAAAIAGGQVPSAALQEPAHPQEVLPMCPV